MFVSVPEGVEVPPSSEGHVYTGQIAQGRWVDADDLKPGFKLLGEDASWTVVVSIEIEEVPLKAYNLTLDDWHTYFVRADLTEGLDAVWVHNDCRPVPQHVFDGHVGKSDSFLARRLDNEGIDQASTFTSQQSAQRLTNSVLDSSGGQTRIAKFLDQPDLGARLRLDSNELDIVFSRPTGNTVLRGNRSSQPANGVRVIIERDPTSTEGFRIVTSFPRSF